MTIPRICPDCNETRRVKIDFVREKLRNGTLTKYCSRCAPKYLDHLQSGETHGAWRGGKYKTKGGYIRVLDPDRKANIGDEYIFEHRLMMGLHLGRKLLPVETVHHKNGIKDDNRLENLELWHSAHAAGMRYEDMTQDEVETLISHLKTLLVK